MSSSSEVVEIENDKKITEKFYIKNQDFNYGKKWNMIKWSVFKNLVRYCSFTLRQSDKHKEIRPHILVMK